MDGLLLIPIALPAAAGVLLLVSSFLECLRARGTVRGREERDGADVAGESGARKQDDDVAEVQSGARKRDDDVAAGESGARRQAEGAGMVPARRKGLWLYVGIVLAASVVLALSAAWTGEKSITLFQFLDTMPICFHVDDTGRFFVSIVSVVWLLAGVYAFRYMEHEGGEKRFFGFFLLTYGILVGLDFAGNLATMYLFYELTTLASMPLVLHNGTREAVMAALKYLFYSLCGAYGGLFGFFFLYRYCGTLDFVPGGTLDMAAVQGHEGILLIALFALLMGFGAKAGMLPLHAWLPAAHPVAPSPASAVLSAVIAKSGVLAVIRVVFYIVGADFLRGTWVQYAWMVLALLTVFMGSMLAYREQGFKKRLAYSTVSQISYIMFGLSLLTPVAMAGALLHVAAHALIKCGLFLTAGLFLYRFGYTKAGQLAGMGKRMPKTMWCYTFYSLGLIGIPPTCGFISKWYLAQGALESGTGIFSWLGPVVLLVSALLTAGYLLPIVMDGFFPGTKAVQEGSEADKAGGTRQTSETCHGKENSQVSEACQGNEACQRSEAYQVSETYQVSEAYFSMLLPLVILAVLVLALGILPGPLVQYVTEIASSVSG